MSQRFTYSRDRVVFLSEEITEENTIGIKERLNQLSVEAVEPIYLVIDSEGGLKIKAFSIYDTIQNLPAPVYTIVEGQAASAAVTVFLAGEKRFITKHSTIKIHNSTIDTEDGMADAKQLRTGARKLQKIVNDLIDFYHQHTKLSKIQIKRYLNMEKRFNAEEAVEYGFAHKII